MAILDKTVASNPIHMPGAELQFAPVFSEPVAMRIDMSAHYQLDDEDSEEEFGKLLPHGGHVIHLSDPEYPSAPPQPYTVMLFHQLKCLGVMREEYAAARDEPSALTQHCLNYLRQTIICRPNLLAESAWNSEGTAIRGYDTVCHDWTKLYEEAERNQETYSAHWA